MELLEARVQELDSQINELTAERHKLRQQIAELMTPFKVGDMVHQNKGVTFQITRICYGYLNKPELFGARIKKDGTPSIASSRLYEWGEKDKIRLV